MSDVRFYIHKSDLNTLKEKIIGLINPRKGELKIPRSAIYKIDDNVREITFDDDALENTGRDPYDIMRYLYRINIPCWGYFSNIDGTNIFIHDGNKYHEYVTDGENPVLSFNLEDRTIDADEIARLVEFANLLDQIKRSASRKKKRVRAS